MQVAGEMALVMNTEGPYVTSEGMSYGMMIATLATTTATTTTIIIIIIIIIIIPLPVQEPGDEEQQP